MRRWNFEVFILSYWNTIKRIHQEISLKRIIGAINSHIALHYKYMEAFLESVQYSCELVFGDCSFPNGAARSRFHIKYVRLNTISVQRSFRSCCNGICFAKSNVAQIVHAGRYLSVSYSSEKLIVRHV